MSCRKAREFLLQRRVSFVEHDLARQPLTVEEIQTLLAGRTAGEIFSWKSVRAREEGLKPGALSDEELVRLMAADASLIKRPLLAVDGKLLPGFDPVAWEQSVAP